MKKLLLLSICLLLSFSSYGQEKIEVNKNRQFSITANMPIGYKIGSYEGYTMPSISLVIINRKKRFPTIYSINIGKEIDYKNGYLVHFVYGVEVSKFFGKKLSFEVGTGLSYNWDIDFTMKYGLRYKIGNRLLIKGAYTPYFRTGITKGFPFLGVNRFFTFSVGYQFGANTNKKITSAFAFIGDRTSLQFSLQPFFRYIQSIIERTYPIKELALNYQLFKVNRFQIVSNLGVGFTKFDTFFPVGLHLFYVLNNHNFGIGANYLFRKYKYFNYEFFQPEIAYQLNFGKRFYGSVGYAPYLWINKSNKEDRKFFAGNMRFGVGVRFL